MNIKYFHLLDDLSERRRKSWWNYTGSKLQTGNQLFWKKHLLIHNTLYEHISLLQNMFQRKSLCLSLFYKHMCRGEKSSISISGRKQSISPWVWNSFNKSEIHNSSNFNFQHSIIKKHLMVSCDSINNLSIQEV